MRSTIINKNALSLATWLDTQPKVMNVRYLGLPSNSAVVYDAVMRSTIPLNLITRQEEEDDAFTKDLLRSSNQEYDLGVHRAGYGCLLSFELHPSLHTKVFYDHLLVNKGPSLGTNFTLVCPYTLLAHYCELDWAAGFGVSSHLIRVSVGLEDPQVIIQHETYFFYLQIH